MREPVEMLNTDLQICGSSLESNIEKNESKKESKGLNELLQQNYSSEIIIVSRISSLFSPSAILGLHKWKFYALNSRELFDSRLLGANSQKEDNKEIKLHVFSLHYQ